MKYLHPNFALLTVNRSDRKRKREKDKLFFNIESHEEDKEHKQNPKTENVLLV